MPSINEAARIHSLLERRAEIARTIMTLNKIDDLEIIVGDTGEKSRNLNAPHFPSFQELLLYGRAASRDTSDKSSVEKFRVGGKDKEDQTLVRVFLLRLFWDKLAAVDLELHDAGFDFPEGYADEMRQHQEAMKPYRKDQGKNLDFEYGTSPVTALDKDVFANLTTLRTGMDTAKEGFDRSGFVKCNGDTGKVERIVYVGPNGSPDEFMHYLTNGIEPRACDKCSGGDADCPGCGGKGYTIDGI